MGIGEDEDEEDEDEDEEAEAEAEGEVLTATPSAFLACAFGRWFASNGLGRS